MTSTTFLFALFAGILLLAAIRVITARNPVHAVLFLVLAFFSAACLWMLLQAEFLAIALVLVYVGAVMVLFLFVVMMLDVNTRRLREGLFRHLWAGVLVAALIVLQMWLVLSQPRWQGMTHAGPGIEHANNIEALGKLTFTEYVFPLQIAGTILLVAIVAAIALTLRGRKDSRHQDPSQQVKVRREERVRLVDMASDEAARQTPGAATCGTRASRREAGGGTMISLSWYLGVGALLFAISIVGIFLNRRNLIVLLMAIELMLLAVNMNFIAFSHFLGDYHGQVFVFFILTVAAAESAIGLAILVILFRNLSTINVEELDSLKG